MASRNLYLTNIPVEEALEVFLKALKPFAANASEECQVIDSLGRITSQAVFALHNSPLYDCAAMDGAAVASQKTHGASESSPVILKKGDGYEPIDTGDPIKQPYDAVIMAEDIEEISEDEIQIRAAAAPWQHVRPVGEDIVAGEMILPSNHKIRPMDIGALLSGGIVKINIRKQLRAAIIPTGTEMVEPGDEIKEGGIIESNSRMFEALVRQSGGLPTRYSPIDDDYGLIRDAIKRAADEHDIVLVSAGTSAGREDYTVHILRELGEVAVHGVAMKPGKPVILAVVNGKPVVGIPGYPVSAYLSYETFVAPVIASLSGEAVPKAPVIEATLTRRMPSSLKHREYVRVKIGKISDHYVASPLSRGAGAAMSLVKADGFCVIDQDKEGIEAGETISVSLCRSLDELENTVVCIGSHDLVLDIISDIMPNIYPGMRLSSSHVGSMGGLMALKNNEAHIAPTHLLDEKTGEYNAPIIKSMFSGRKMALIKGVGRVQGIMVQKGNPHSISGIKSLSAVRYVNRQRGAGTRALLDYLLKQEGIQADEIAGYEREAATHMAVAAAISGGSADAGMGVLSAAQAMGLDFLPIADEDYDFALPAEHLGLAHIQAFIETLKSENLHAQLDRLGGYSYANSGQVVYFES
ncbi:MAG: molybdopterin biosynthesis protein [Eubacteriaceae bacterium]|nr:molybdopterin biosynthesis protein [Eubacteriaceae bacterium]